MLTKESESSPIVVTNIPASVQKPATVAPESPATSALPTVVFLDPPQAGTLQAEIVERPIKRPRVGSVSSNITQTQLKVRTEIDQNTPDVPRVSSDDETHHEAIQTRLPACSSSEFGFETSLMPMLTGRPSLKL